MITKKSIHIGCSGFYNAHWKKIFYPETLPANQWLNFYSEKLTTLEIDSTFYRFPSLANLTTWYKKTPAQFSFSVKAPKVITHLNKFTDCQQLMDDFYAVCKEGLQEKLATLLFQLPPSISFSEEKLEQIMRYLDPSFLNVVEFRHQSWWNEKVYHTLTDHKIIFCSVNHPKMPNTIIGNSGKAYIRLHGNPEMFYSNYSLDFLTKLSQFILNKKDLTEVFIYFNNTASTSGILNAQQLQQIIDAGLVTGNK